MTINELESMVKATAPIQSETGELSSLNDGLVYVGRYAMIERHRSCDDEIKNK